MKKFVRLLIVLIIMASMAGITTSCAVFNDSHGQNQVSFKHKKPLPKRYIIKNGETHTIK
jgi:hypothetical protein